MRSFRVLLVLALVSCGAGPKSGTGPRKPLTAAEISAKWSPSIVRIEAGDGTGTGFVVASSGLIATNLHVVVGRSDITVKLPSGEVFSVVEIAGLDPARDLALLKIAPGKVLPAAKLGDSSKLVAGDQVVAIGNPLGVFANSVTSGLVSQVRPVCTREQVELHNKNSVRHAALVAKLEGFGKCQVSRAGGCEALKLSEQEEQELETLRCRDELTILQISAPISQGSSGGPLFNLYGEVVGVTTAIITAGQNINLAIPSNYVKSLVEHPTQISMDEFAKKTKTLAERESSQDDGVRIQRLVPDHAASIFKDCKSDQIADMVLAVEQAIEVGAPLYNKGEIEACFRIYEGTAIKFERDPSCPGISSAFVDGLSRAKTLDTYKEKAWAMRDTFDGLLKAARRWALANPNQAKPAESLKQDAKPESKPDAKPGSKPVPKPDAKK